MGVVVAPTPVTVAAVQELLPFAIPDNATQLKIKLARATALTPTLWANSTTHVNADVYLSLDGGVTFNYAFGVGAEGGVLTTKDGEFTDAFVQGTLPSGINRQGKLVLTVTNGPLVSTATIEAI